MLVVDFVLMQKAVLCDTVHFRPSANILIHSDVLSYKIIYGKPMENRVIIHPESRAQKHFQGSTTRDSHPCPGPAGGLLDT